MLQVPVTHHVARPQDLEHGAPRHAQQLLAVEGHLRCMFEARFQWPGTLPPSNQIRHWAFRKS